MGRSFIDYIKCVGTGAKHNRDLTYQEMLDAMHMMLDGSASPEQTAAFLLGWRLKPESTEEFRAALQAIDETSIKSEVENGIELGYPFDGKVDNPYIFPLAARIVEPFGINVVVSGGALQPAKGGATVKEVVKAVDLPENVRYFDRSDYNPKLAALTGIRTRLGIRTGINTIERLPGVAGCDTALIGVFHKPYVKKYVEIFGERYRRLVIVKGNEGTPEIFGKCRVWIHENGETEELLVDSARFGVEYRKSFRPIEKEEGMEMLKNPSKELMEVAVLNAAFWLFAKGEAESVEAAMKMVTDY
ncbi:anthranilate phosphoribosyltransferase like [Hydrogenimonas sp.]|nr:anthranilate phosphoribosyltransferase like [Hydrogenimonas sp.]